MSTEHVLDAIDGALAWDPGMGDAMTWSPPEEHHSPPPAPPRPPARQPVTRITVIVEQGDRVSTLDIPAPQHAEFNWDIHEEPERWYALGRFALPRRRSSLSFGVDLGEEGFDQYEGRDHAMNVLRRLGEG